MAHATEVKKDAHPTSSRAQTPLKDIQKTLPLRVLSQMDFTHWQRKGFVIVRDAVPAENVERLKALLWEFEEKDPDDPATWYAPQRRDHKMLELNNSGMVEIYNHQFLWDNRTQQRVYDAFVDIWDVEDLWVGIDRANLNPPNKGDRANDGFIHWDADTSLEPPPISVQGVLSLVKQDGDIGGFQCVPYLFEHFDDWVKTQPADRDPHHPDMTGLEIEKVTLNPGDLMIFNSLLAHGVAPNTSKDRVRMAQYISMFPADPGDENELKARIHSWSAREAPIRAAFPGDPREWEKTKYSTAVLDELGRKLLGVTPWR